MIQSFIDSLQYKIEVIDTLACKPNQGTGVTGNKPLYLQKKILYVCLLDYFSSIRFHKTSYARLYYQNRERFVRFLKECTNWREGRLISLLFLSELLSKASICGSLATYVENKLKRIPDFGNTISASGVDEELESLSRLAATEKEKKAIMYCQHYFILYRYRNSLIHNASLPGGANDMMGLGQDEACYHNYAGDQGIYLLYPVGLLKKLCKNSLMNLKGYLETNRIDPDSLDVETRHF